MTEQATQHSSEGHPSRTDRADFIRTSDPALDARADAGAADFKLLDYHELYELW